MSEIGAVALGRSGASAGAAAAGGRAQHGAVAGRGVRDLSKDVAASAGGPPGGPPLPALKIAQHEMRFVVFLGHTNNGTGSLPILSDLGKCIEVAAGITLFVVSIMNLIGSLDNFTTGAIFLGCGGFIAVFLTYKMYNAYQDIKKTQNGREIAWKSSAMLIHLQVIPWLVGGTLAMTGVLPAQTLGWFYFAPGAVTTLVIYVALIRAGYNLYKDIVQVMEPRTFYERMTQDRDLEDNHRNLINNLKASMRQQNLTPQQKNNIFRSTFWSIVAFEMIKLEGLNKEFSNEIKAMISALHSANRGGLKSVLQSDGTTKTLSKEEQIIDAVVTCLASIYAQTNQGPDGRAVQIDRNNPRAVYNALYQAQAPGHPLSPLMTALVKYLSMEFAIGLPTRMVGRLNLAKELVESDRIAKKLILSIPEAAQLLDIHADQ